MSKTRTKKTKKPRKPKAPPTLHELRIRTLRRASMRWPYKYEALNLAKVYVDDWVIDAKGKKTKVQYRCASCKNLFSRKQVCVDHIDPVVDVEDGFTGWNDYVPKLLCVLDNLQVLCKKPCHAEKTAKENAERGIHRKVQKIKKKSKKKR